MPTRITEFGLMNVLFNVNEPPIPLLRLVFIGTITPA